MRQRVKTIDSEWIFHRLSLQLTACRSKIRVGLPRKVLDRAFLFWCGVVAASNRMTGHLATDLESGRHVARRVRSVMFCLAAISLWLALLPGCSGCRKTNSTPAKKKKTTREQDLKKREELKKKKKKKPDFQISKLRTLPSDDSTAGSFVKPGHIVSAAVDARANNFDFRGRFNAATVDRKGHPLFVEGTKYHVTVTRKVALPKGRTRSLVTTFFVPRTTRRDAQTMFLQHSLLSDHGGQVVTLTPQITRRMPAYQYLLVVLAKTPDSYGYLKQLESVRTPYNELLNTRGPIIYYRVLLPNLQKQVPLPSHPFAYSSLAYIVWDDVRPSRFSSAQQTALLDWLYWGGQIIVNGPHALDVMKDSFLQDYLPAQSDGAMQLGPEQFVELNKQWSLRRAKTGELLGLNVLAEKPLAGTRLKVSPGGTFIPNTGRLVAERRVGRGRIVVTAFSLTSRPVVNWQSLDGFWNGCLLRRPPRRFKVDPNGVTKPTWRDFPDRITDARFTTSVRFFARDVGIANAGEPKATSDWHLNGARPDPQSGLGGWNSHSGAAEVAYATLRKAAGITVPKARFVVQVLVVYLLILVPVNWAFFRLIGHVEWAWIAAPIIAIVGALVVIRMAQLDIGFVRSRTELAIAEMQPGYSQVHLSRYLALYSSLASRYEFQFPENPYAVALPFPSPRSADRVRELVFFCGRDTKLTGFQVASNSTAFVHSEEMVDLGGTVQLVHNAGQWQVVNHTKLDLHDTGILRRTAGGRAEICALGTLKAGQLRTLRFEPSESDPPWLPEWYMLETSDKSSNTIDMKNLFSLAARHWQLRAGDVRLIAWTDQPIQGMTIAPRASQRQTRTMVLVHLRYGSLPPPERDANSILDAVAPPLPHANHSSGQEQITPGAPSSTRRSSKR